jgi:hypothetical protein
LFNIISYNMIGKIESDEQSLEKYRDHTFFVVFLLPCIVPRRLVQIMKSVINI